MGLDLEYINGQTPLEEEEKDDLKIPTIATRGELDEFEQQNIEEAIQWLLTKTLNAKTILSEQFVKELHKRMFGNVWDWAGTFRKTNKNIGVDKWQISTILRTLLGDTLYWIENSTYLPDEIAVRFKHRLVSIHCFPNGNGRHSRLMADIIIDKIFKLPVFTWGAEDLVKQSETRNKYIEAIKKADNDNCESLISFARSQTTNLIGYIREQGFGWWHYLKNTWLIVDSSGKSQASEIRDKVREVFDNEYNITFQINSSGDTWPGFGPKPEDKNMFKWIHEN